MNEQETGRDVIGDFVELRFTGLPSSSFMRGKVDTGATICSLHCDSHQIDEKSNQITFKCGALSQNSITVPLSDRQAVRTADNGTEYRPVIEMDVKIGDKVLEKIKFNLNDRSSMDCPILVGQNLIKAGNYLIDPKQVSEATTVKRLEDEEPEIDVDGVLDSVVSAINGGKETDDVGEIDVEEVDIDSDLEDIESEKDDTISDTRRKEIDDVYQMMRNSNVTLMELLRYAEGYINK